MSVKKYSERSTQRYELTLPVRDASILDAIRKQVKKRPRYGYRRITIKLRNDGWVVNFKRVYRIWHCYDLKGYTPKRPKKRYCGCGENACNIGRAEYINHVWTYDFMTERIENGRKVRLLNVLDEFTRESLTIDVGKRITSQDVIDVLRYLFLIRGEPAYIRSDNGPEFTAKKVKKWLRDMDVKTLFIEPGSPWENGYIESFNAHLRDELLYREIFCGIEELRYVVERWRMDYNHHRPHSSIGYMTPAAFAADCIGSDSTTLRQPQCREDIPETLSQQLVLKKGADQLRSRAFDMGNPGTSCNYQPLIGPN